MPTKNPAAVPTTVKDLSKWGQMYQSRVGNSYPAYCRRQYLPFLSLIRQHIIGRCTIREEGCGVGTITKILAQDCDHEKVKFFAFDYDETQVSHTRANLNSLPFDVTVYQGSHFDHHGCVDVIHAHGVLEHFSDEEIRQVLMRQADEARVVIHYVPLEGWVSGSYGDERLLPLSHWVDAFTPDYYETFNGGRDVALMWIGHR